MSSRGPIARRGAVVVWVALLGVVLIGFVGLAMDAGVVLLAGSHLQIAADAGSLAAARLVRADDLSMPRQAAFDIAFENKAAGVPVSLDLNGANDPAGEIVIGRFYRFADPLADPPRCPIPPCFFPQIEKPNAVKVNARRTNGSIDDQVPLVFGAAPLFNVQGIDVTRTATAIISGGTGAGLLVLCPDCSCALDFSGNTDLVLQSAPGWDGDTAIQVNSNDNCAACGSGSTLSIEAPEMNIVGFSGEECWAGDPILDTFINEKSPPMPDPLAGLPAPSWGAPNNPGIIDKTTVKGVCKPSTLRCTAGNINVGGACLVDSDCLAVVDGVCDPGTLLCTAGKVGMACSVASVSDCDVAKFSPGYYPGGINIRATGDFAFLEPGVYVVDGQGLFVNGGNLTAHGVLFYVIGTGRVYLGGNGTIDITPSDVEGDTYWGVSIFQARDNINPATIIGTSKMNLEGTYYFPVAPVEIGGEGIAIGNQLIAWTMWIHGRGVYTLQYDGRFPAPGSKVFLVQ